jgi:hypothetical protein
MLRKLQIWHLTLLIAIPLLYAVFKLWSEPNDPWRTRFFLVITVVGSIWASLLLIITIIKGPQVNVVATVINAYRELLNKLPFLIISNLILSLVTGLLVWQLLMYRQVEFVSNQSGYIYLEEGIGPNYRLGPIEQDKPVFYRLRTGLRRMVLKSAYEEVLYSSAENVEPFWQKSEAIKIIIKVEIRKVNEELTLSSGLNFELHLEE